MPGSGESDKKGKGVFSFRYCLISVIIYSIIITKESITMLLLIRKSRFIRIHCSIQNGHINSDKK